VINSSQYVYVGHSKEIHCVANTSERVNSLAVNITWIGPNGPITNNSRLSITPTVSNGINHISTLRFLYLNEDDEGLYECNVAVLEMSKTEFHSLINFNSKHFSCIHSCTYAICIDVCTYMVEGLLHKSQQRV